MAGRCGPVNCCRSFSRIFGAPQPGYSRFKRTIVASMGAGSRFACLIQFCPSTQATARSACPGQSAHGPRIPSVGCRHHAAASIDGHVLQAADRLASARARRAATAPDVRSAGTASPVPKYISSGVCPRNAEWGSTRLCSST
jgi:hypothetical protein